MQANIIYIDSPSPAPTDTNDKSNNFARAEQEFIPESTQLVAIINRKQRSKHRIESESEDDEVGFNDTKVTSGKNPESEKLSVKNAPPLLVPRGRAEDKRVDLIRPVIMTRSKTRQLQLENFDSGTSTECRNTSSVSNTTNKGSSGQKRNTKRSANTALLTKRKRNFKRLHRATKKADNSDSEQVDKDVENIIVEDDEADMENSCFLPLEEEENTQEEGFVDNDHLSNDNNNREGRGGRLIPTHSLSLLVQELRRKDQDFEDQRCGRFPQSRRFTRQNSSRNVTNSNRMQVEEEDDDDTDVSILQNDKLQDKDGQFKSISFRLPMEIFSRELPQVCEPYRERDSLLYRQFREALASRDSWWNSSLPFYKRISDQLQLITLGGAKR